MNVLDLFSGIGGFSLGLERAGMRTVAFCEINPYCRRVLAKHWPDVPIYDDVRTIPRIGCDLIAGGFPCQPWSHAGKQLGTQDDRDLWPEMLEVIKRERPTWVLGENVTGLISLGLDRVLADLEAAAYAVRTFVIPALACDAPHRRDRLWIVACDRDRDRESDCAIHAEMERLQSDLADSSEPGSQGSGAKSEVRRRGKPAGSSWDAHQWWEPEPAVDRMAHGIPNRMGQLAALGNAVVPQVVEIIGRAIMRHEGSLNALDVLSAI